MIYPAGGAQTQPNKQGNSHPAASFGLQERGPPHTGAPKKARKTYPKRTKQEATIVLWYPWWRVTPMESAPIRPDN